MIRPELRYFTTASIWLDLADHLAAGLRRPDIGLRIMQLPDPGTRDGTLSCRPAADSSMLSIGTCSVDPEVHAVILSDIAELLDVMLAEREVATAPMLRQAEKPGWLETIRRRVRSVWP